MNVNQTNKKSGRFPCRKRRDSNTIDNIHTYITKSRETCFSLECARRKSSSTYISVSAALYAKIVGTRSCEIRKLLRLIANSRKDLPLPDHYNNVNSQSVSRTLRTIRSDDNALNGLVKKRPLDLLIVFQKLSKNNDGKTTMLMTYVQLLTAFRNSSRCTEAVGVSLQIAR